MTQDNPLKNYVKDFEKVCKASSIISQVCQMQGRPHLERSLLNKWACMVLDNQKYGGEHAFTMARNDFIQYLKHPMYLDDKDPLLLFLIDTLWLIY